MQEPSVYLPFQTIDNCRDLAGMKTASGKSIKPGKLIRAAHLGRADEHDRLTLENLGISDVVDFRTDWEIMLKPDRKIKNAAHHHDPVYHETDLKNAAGSQLKFVEEAAEDSRKMLEAGYRAAIKNPDSIKAWRKYFDILLNAEGGVLFHCTQGKDRTGLAAALIETALGVGRQDVLDDYMQTNLYMTKAAEEDRMAVMKLFNRHLSLAEEDIDTYLFAHEDCFQAAEQEIINGWGSWQGYLQDAIGLSDAEIALLQEKYLA